MKRSRTELLGIDQQADFQWKFVSAWKLRTSCGGFLVIDYLKVVLLEIGDAAPVFVGDREDYVHLVRSGSNCGE